MQCAVVTFRAAVTWKQKPQNKVVYSRSIFTVRTWEGGISAVRYEKQDKRGVAKRGPTGCGGPQRVLTPTTSIGERDRGKPN